MNEMAATACSIEGCEKKVTARGWCKRHYGSWLDYGDPLVVGTLKPGPKPRPPESWPPCSVDGCDRRSKVRGLCPLHYGRLRLQGSPGKAELQREPPGSGKLECSVEGCTSLRLARTFCSMHYNRWIVSGETGSAGRVKAADGNGYVGPDGYRILCRMGHPNAAKNGRIAEHRFVMSEALGRPLLPKETVHHKNGNRLDNRLDNLELWTGHHGYGQRVEDVVRFSIEMLQRYAPERLA